MVEKTIFEYLDYRDFLKDHYEDRKNSYHFFSFRYIALKTGLDASFYAKVLQKQQHLSLKSIPVMVKFLRLKKKESEYFTLLVRFNRTKHQEEARLYFEKIIELRELPANKFDIDGIVGQHIITNPLWNSQVKENFQYEMFHLGENAISWISKPDLETSTVSINLSKKCFSTLKERLLAFNKELMELAKVEKEPDSVFQINFQIFPFTCNSE
jgi:hypothetical protein